MKKTILTFVIFFILNFQNKKTDIYFLYRDNIPTIESKKTILIEGQTFQVEDKINKCKTVNIVDYKNKIISLKEFYRKYNIKNFDDLIKYDLHIIVPINKTDGEIFKIEYSLVINEPIE